MGSAARKYESEPFMSEHAVLEERVDNLKNVKADVKHLAQKIDAVSASLTEHRLETKDAFAKLRDETTGAIANLRNDLTASVGELRLEMKGYFDKHRHDRTAMILWMIGTMIGALGVAFTAARLLSHS